MRKLGFTIEEKRSQTSAKVQNLVVVIHVTSKILIPDLICIN